MMFAVCILSCKGPAAKVTSDFSGWPINMNSLISDIQANTDGKIEIKEEFENKITPTASSGCILFVPSQSEDSRNEVLGLAFTAINNRLKGNGYKILSTEPTSCKTDFRFVYTGPSKHGSITLKGLTEKDGVQLIICLLEDIPNVTD